MVKKINQTIAGIYATEVVNKNPRSHKEEV
jgi:hypothetical protein